MRAMASFIKLATVALFAFQGTGSYRIADKYPLGGNGGWDYIIPEPSAHRLFIARESRLMVVDEETGKLSGEVTGINGAHGTAIDAKRGHGFATASEDKAVVMFDLKTLKPISKIPADDDADAILYDSASDRVISLNGDPHNATIIDPASGKLVKNLPLGGKPEYGASAGNGKIYANLTDVNQVVEIDPKAAAVLRRWSTGDCKQPVAMAIDTAKHRLFSGCRSGVLAVSDYQAGKVVTTVPIGKGVDGAGFDPASADVFASNGDGTFSVIHQDSADSYHLAQTLTTPVGSRNLGLDPMTHRIFVATAQFGQPAGPKAKKAVVPGSFALLSIQR